MKQEKLLLLFPLTGIYGLLFLAEGVDLLQFYRPAVYGFAAVFGLALWALAVFAGKFLAPVLAAAAAGWTVAFFLAGQELLEEFRLAGRILAGEYSGEAVTVTTAVLFLIPVVLSLIFFWNTFCTPTGCCICLPVPCCWQRLWWGWRYPCRR